MREKKILLSILIFFTASYKLFSQENNESIVRDTVKLSLSSKESLDTNSFNIFPKNYSHKKIALVLSGGGARGIAQLGVLKVLEENNVRLDLIVGTSIGSIIGGFYSSGYSIPEMKSIFKDFNWERALSLSDKYQRTSLFLEQKKIQDRSLVTIALDGIKPILLPASFSNGQYMSEKINTHILNSKYHPKKSFADLKISFAAVATNLNDGKRVILTEGNLSESIKASLTFPLLYTPIDIAGRKLVDGGLTSNIPIDVAKKLGAVITIAVNSTSPLRSNEELDDPLNTADQVLSITMSQFNNLQLKDADIVINPEINNHSSSDFTRINYLISQGEQKTLELIDKIKLKIDSLELSESEYFNNFVINPQIVVNSTSMKDVLQDSLLKLSDPKFVKYTSIEKNLKDFYKMGFFKDAYAVISRDEHSATIAYNFLVNPELQNLRVKNSFTFLDSLFTAFRKTNLNKPVNYNECFKLYDDILTVLRRESYPLIEIEKFYFNYNNSSLEIDFNEGKIDDLILTGNTVTNNNVILRELKIDKNLPIEKKDVNASLENIMSTNLFQQVSLDFDYKRNLFKPDLKIKVIEKNTKALRFSLKADNERNLQLLLDLRDENIFGSAVEAGILAAGGLRNRIYQFEVKSNQFFSLPLTFNFNGYYTFRDINRYVQFIDTIKNEINTDKIGEYRNLRNGGLSFLFGTQLQRLGTIYGQVFIENQEIKNKFDSEDLNAKLRVVKFKFGGIFDTEDVLPFPTSGTLINFYYESAKNILEGNLSYSKLYIGYEQYLSIAKSQTLKPKFIFGFADRTTPLTEQYSIGGEKSFFGMVEDELRGRQILSTSLEYRLRLPYKLFFDTYFSVRYDLGNVWRFTEDIRFKDLRHGIGVTAAFDTPIGEASFSAGKSFIITKGFTKNSFIFGPYNFYFSIGYDI